MTKKQANDVWLVLTSQVIFRQWAATDFKDDPDRMRTFTIAVMKKGGVKRAAKVYDWVTQYLNSKGREAIAGDIMEYPDLLMHWAENPIWKQVGVPVPWTEH